MTDEGVQHLPGFSHDPGMPIFAEDAEVNNIARFLIAKRYFGPHLALAVDQTLDLAAVVRVCACVVLGVGRHPDTPLFKQHEVDKAPAVAALNRAALVRVGDAYISIGP